METLDRVQLKLFRVLRLEHSSGRDSEEPLVIPFNSIFHSTKEVESRLDLWGPVATDGRIGTG